MRTCLYLCALVRARLGSHSGIVNADSFQLESALSNKQTSGEESGEGLQRKNITTRDKCRENHQGGGPASTGR